MFCCPGSKCMEDGILKEEIKDRRTQNQQLYLQRSAKESRKVDGKLGVNIVNHMTKDKVKIFQPAHNHMKNVPPGVNHVNHVNHVQRDVYVKLSGVHRQSGNSKTLGYQGGNYHVIQIPKSQSAVIRQSPKRAPITNLDLIPANRAKTVQKENTNGPLSYKTEIKKSNEEYRTSTPFEIPHDGIKLSNDEAVAIFENMDAESLTGEQRNALEQLEDTLKDYHIDDDETPMIVADVLPYGVFEDIQTSSKTSLSSPTSSPPSPPISSEDEPSSRTSSLSNKSFSSVTGIISQTRHSLGSKKNRNSVSFQLPVDHVDKPYAPMQTSAKSKQNLVSVTTLVPEPVVHPPAICISGTNVHVWHTGSQVYVDNQRRSSGPFKGSFKSLFYRKYNNAGLSSYHESKTYLTPKILEKVSSFESLTDEIMDKRYRGNAAIVRRNTVR